MRDQISMLWEQQWKTEIKHIPRKANQVADLLAKHAIEAPPGFHDIERPWVSYVKCCSKT